MKSSYMKQMLSGNRQYRRAFVLAVAVPILCAAAAALVLRVMKELGLDVPQVTELAWELKKAGVPIKFPILTRKELTEELIRLGKR